MNQLEHNVTTNEITEVEMTPEEIAAVEATAAELEASRVASEAQATAKAALLAQLGITEDQARLLLS